MPQVDLSDLEPVDYNPFATPAGPLANRAPSSPPQDMTSAARSGQLGTLSADNPSWGDRLAGGFSNLMGWVGATPQGQRNAYDVAQKTTGLIPGVNNAVSANQAYRDFGSGNYLGGALNTIGAVIPPIPGASMGERTLASVLAKEAEPIGGRVMMEGGTPGLLAYHGSRHDFPMFDMSKIDTGEGAQVYGHGLYFAEHPEVAENYRTAGSYDQPKLFDPEGNLIDLPVNSKDPVAEANEYIRMGNSFQGARNMQDLAVGGPSSHSDFDKQVRSQIDAWEQSGHTIQGAAEGYKYQVAIPHDPDTFFDLDANFGDQHPDVQKAANQIFGRKFQKDISGNDVYDYLNEAMENRASTDQRSLSGIYGGDSHVELADELNKRGIPGIRYLDEGSRGEQPHPFNPNLRLSDHPQNIQDNIRKLVPDASPDDLMSNIHYKLHGNLLDDAIGDRSVEEALGDPNVGTHDFYGDANKALLKAGVPSYTASPTRNYVAFSDKNISILKKWGTGGALIGGTMAAGPSSAQDFYRNHPDLDRHSLTEVPDGGQ